MSTPLENIHIQADYRESPSGIPSLLVTKGIQVTVTPLKTGDYIINGRIAIERKTGEDFIQSLISERLFRQCAKLASSGYRPILLLEGSPFQTVHQIDRKAVKGALLSVIASWQIPVIYSKNKDDSTEQLVLLAKQDRRQALLVKSSGYKSKRIKTQRMRFLQGLPGTGPVMASRLLNHFGSIEKIAQASLKELLEIEGIGKRTAIRIRSFLSEEQ